MYVAFIKMQFLSLIFCSLFYYNIHLKIRFLRSTMDFFLFLIVKLGQDPHRTALILSYDKIPFYCICEQ